MRGEQLQELRLSRIQFQFGLLTTQIRESAKRPGKASATRTSSARSRAADRRSGGPTRVVLPDGRAVRGYRKTLRRNPPRSSSSATRRRSPRTCRPIRPPSDLPVAGHGPGLARASRLQHHGAARQRGPDSRARGAALLRPGAPARRVGRARPASLYVPRRRHPRRRSADLRPAPHRGARGASDLGRAD
jgi:hypothetical protein